MITVACTGHRPQKLGGYILPNPTYIHICQQIEKHLLQIKPDKAISGMALGADQYFANVCIKLNIPLIAAIPFIGQEKAWPVESQRTYNKLLSKAEEQIIVSPGGYASFKMQKRNEFMVDNCNILLAVFDQSSTSGGTFNCIQYAESKNKNIIFINPILDINLF